MRRVSAMKAASVGAIQPSTDKLKVQKLLCCCLFSFSHSCSLEEYHNFIFSQISFSEAVSVLY